MSMSTRPTTAAMACLLLLLASSNTSLDAFHWSPIPGRSVSVTTTATEATHTQQRAVALLPSWSRPTTRLAAQQDASNQKRRRRKRKKSAAPPPGNAPAVDAAKKESARAMAQQLIAQEQAMFDEEDKLTTSFDPPRLEEDDRVAAAAAKAGFSVSDSTNPPSQLEDLFDSRDFLQRRRTKELEEEANEGKPSTAVPTRKKIKRSDIKAYEALLEMDPTADEDDSYFEDEGIDFISALLGDVEPGVGYESDESANQSGNKIQKRTSFLGIGSGPLQVGHFIGALGVILMAFVEYPGFPLTNLPDPLRGALQGGLGSIYLVNTVLAVFSAISAPSRKQSSLLWGAKTFAVGAIAYDQLMQIPTPEELRERARKEEELVKRRQGRRGKRQK